MIPWYCSQQVYLFAQSAILSFEVIISSKWKLSVHRSRYREDYWRSKKKESPLCLYFWLNNSHFTTEIKVAKCRLYCPISSLLVLSNCDTFQICLFFPFMTTFPLTFPKWAQFFPLTCCAFLLLPLGDQTYFKSLFSFPHACQADVSLQLLIPPRQSWPLSRAWKPLFRQAASSPDS